MSTNFRPGGALASRPLHFFWVVDCSGSMYGDKIGIVNNAIETCLPEMRETAEDNPNASLLVRTMSFSNTAQWINPAPTKIENYTWENLQAKGFTALGAALNLLSAELNMPPMPARALPPVIVLLSDGQPTDEYKKPLEHFLSLRWAKKAVKIAISIGHDADDDVLAAFTGNKDLVLQANNATDLVKMIKWASTVAGSVSTPQSRMETISDSSDDSWFQGVDIGTRPETSASSGTDDDWFTAFDSVSSSQSVGATVTIDDVW